ncbi:MAG: T9SS type A sorting domain-containing protein, partial [Calditrichota bacterium]
DCDINYLGSSEIGPPITFKNQSDNNLVENCVFTGNTTGSIFTGYHNLNANPVELASINNRIAGCNSSAVIEETVHTGSDSPHIEYAFWEEWKVDDAIAGSDPAFVSTTNSFSNFKSDGEHTQLLKIDLSSAGGFTTSYNATTNVHEIACSDNRPRKVTVTVTDMHDNPVAGVSGNTTHEVENWVVETVDIISNDFNITGNGETATFSNGQGEDMLLYTNSSFAPIATILNNGSYFLSLNKSYRVEVDLSSGSTTTTVKPTGIISKFDQAEHNSEPALSSPVLIDNYPNPFNPTTTIRYTIDVPQFIELSVYDISGKKVNTLIHQTQNAGEHSVIWNATNDNGEHVASGVYIYQLRGENFSSEGRMQLIR